MKKYLVPALVGTICLIVGYLTGHAVGSDALLRWFYGTEKSEAYYKALGAVQSDAKILTEFRRLFPGAVERVRYFGPGHQPGFDVEVHLHKRYRLALQLPVVFNVSGDRVIGYGAPAFYLNEVQKVERTEGGTLAISFNTAGALKFGPEQWHILVERNGDFSALGYKMITDRPISNFDLLTISK